MRLIHLALILSLTACMLYAEDAKPTQSAAGLSQKEIDEGFVSLFDGKTLDGWQRTGGYAVEDGLLVCTKKGRDMFTVDEFGDFILRLEYRLQAGANNGIGIRSPLGKAPWTNGIEIQVLDDSFPAHQKYKPVQFNGCVYGAVAAKRGHMKPLGEWNAIEIRAKGSKIKVTLNGAVILETDLKDIGPTAIHGHKLTGLHREKGHIALCGHNHRIEFRKLRIKKL